MNILPEHFKAFAVSYIIQNSLCRASDELLNLSGVFKSLKSELIAKCILN